MAFYEDFIKNQDDLDRRYLIKMVGGSTFTFIKENANLKLDKEDRILTFTDSHGHKMSINYNHVEYIRDNKVEKSGTSPDKTVENISGTDFSKIWENNKCGIIDNIENKAISEVKYDYINLIGNTECLKTRIDEKYSIFNLSTKKEACIHKYEDIELLSEDNTKYLKVCQNNKWGIWDIKANKQICDIRYDRIDDIHRNGFYKVYIEDKCGLFYLKEACAGGSYVLPSQEIVPVQFSDIVDVGTKDYFKICIDDKWGVYSTSKKSIVIEPEYEEEDIIYRRFNMFNIKGKLVKI